MSSVIPLVTGIGLSSSVTAFCAAYRCRVSGWYAPAGLMATALLLYAAFFCGLPSAGAWTMVVCHILLYLAALPGICRDPSGFCRRFFTPARVMFFLWCAGFFIFNRGRLFYHWDEFSHWGPAVKVMFDTGTLPCASPEDLLFASYPPVMPVFQWFFCFLNGGFTEEVPVFATAVLLFAFLSLGAEHLRWRERGEIIICTLIGWMVPAAFLAFFYSIYVDGVLAMLFGGGIFLALSGGEDAKMRAAVLPLAGAFLVLVKSSGAGLAVLLYPVWLAAVFCRFGDVRETLRREWPGLVLYPAAVVSAAWSWRHLLARYRTPVIFSGEAVEIRQVLRAVLANEPAHAHQVMAAWAGKFLPGIANSGEWYSYTPGVLLITAFLMLAVWKMRRSLPEEADRRVLAVLQTVIPVTVLLFSGTLLVWYIFSFPLREALAAASFDRYVNTVLLAFYFTVLLLAGKCRKVDDVPLPRWVFYLLAVPSFFFLVPFRYILKDLPQLSAVLAAWAAACGALIWFYRSGGRAAFLKKSLFMAVLLVPLIRLPWIGFNLYQIPNGFSYWKRELLEDAVKKLRDEVRPGKNRVLMIHSRGTGEYYHMMRLMAHPFMTNDPWSYRLPGSSDDIWSVESTPAGLFKRISADGFLYCHDADKRFCRDYGTLFGDPPVPGRIYRPGKDGKLYFVR